MITFTGKEVFDSIQVLSKFCAETKLPVKVAYRLSRIYKAIEKEHKILDETRINIVRKYGQEKDPGQFQVLPEKFAEFNKEIEELFSESLEIPFNPVSIELLNGIDVAPANFIVLDKLFVETEPAPTEQKNEPQQ